MAPAEVGLRPSAWVRQVKKGRGEEIPLGRGLRATDEVASQAAGEAWAMRSDSWTSPSSVTSSTS